MNAMLDGVIANVAGIQKPKAAADIVASAQKYALAMAGLNKPCTRISLTRRQYGVLLSAVLKARQDHDPQVVGLTLGKIELVSA